MGDEVRTSFLDGNLYIPLVIGSLYNAINPSLINNPPLNSHKISNSSKTINEIEGKIENGINEITLSNIKERGSIYTNPKRL